MIKEPSGRAGQIQRRDRRTDLKSSWNAEQKVHTKAVWPGPVMRESIAVQSRTRWISSTFWGTTCHSKISKTWHLVQARLLSPKSSNRQCSHKSASMKRVLTPCSQCSPATRTCWLIQKCSWIRMPRSIYYRKGASTRQSEWHLTWVIQTGLWSTIDIKWTARKTLTESQAEALGVRSSLLILRTSKQNRRPSWPTRTVASSQDYQRA